MKQQKTQNPHKLTTDCSQCWHPVHRVAEKDSSLTCISYTCSRTAKFVVWLQKQVVESGRDVTTEQPAVDHIPPASGLTCSKKTEKKYGNYHPLQQKAKVLREFHSPRRSKLKGRRRGYQRQVFIWTSFWLILRLSRFALSIRHARENTSSIKVCVKKHSSAVTALNRTQ